MGRVYKRDLVKGKKDVVKKREGSKSVKPLAKKDYSKMANIALNLRDANKEDPEKYFKYYRDYLFMTISVNMGFRTEVVLEMKPEDIKGKKVTVTEFKTGKRFEFDLNDTVFEEIQKYIKEFHISDHEFFFKKTLSEYDAITRQTMWRRIKFIAKKAKIDYRVGCHSFRKSYGRWMYDEKHDIHLVQQFYKHSSPATTERYIGLEKGDIDAMRKDIEYVPVRA